MLEKGVLVMDFTIQVQLIQILPLWAKNKKLPHPLLQSEEYPLFIDWLIVTRVIKVKLWFKHLRNWGAGEISSCFIGILGGREGIVIFPQIPTVTEIYKVTTYKKWQD